MFERLPKTWRLGTNILKKLRKLPVLFIALLVAALISINVFSGSSGSPHPRPLKPHVSPDDMASKVDLLGRCPPPKSRVAFVKVHKTGSSTIANILQRFGFTRNLNFVVPRNELHRAGYNYIGRPGGRISKDTIWQNVFPPPTNESFDILWNHVVYDRDAFRTIMPPDTVYISILREPFQQFLSAFEYFRRNEVNRLSHTLRSRGMDLEPISMFLQNLTQFLPEGVYFSHTRNKQAYDLGMTVTHLFDPLERSRYINEIDRDFTLVMITDFFDESLVLLKRYLCWDLKDILYIPKNRNMFKKARLFTEGDHMRHQKMSPLDYHLYNYFYRKFWEKVWKEGAEFYDEVRYFKHLLRETLDYCMLGKILHVPSSRWNMEFTITMEDCRLMLLPELPFYDKIIETTYEKLRKTSYKWP